MFDVSESIVCTYQRAVGVNNIAGVEHNNNRRGVQLLLGEECSVCGAHEYTSTVKGLVRVCNKSGRVSGVCRGARHLEPHQAAERSAQEARGGPLHTGQGVSRLCLPLTSTSTPLWAPAHCTCPLLLYTCALTMRTHPHTYTRTYAYIYSVRIIQYTCCESRLPDQLSVLTHRQWTRRSHYEVQSYDSRCFGLEMRRRDETLVPVCSLCIARDSLIALPRDVQ